MHVHTNFTMHNQQYLAEVNKVVVKDDINRARQLSGRSLLWHLLDTQRLVVPVDRQTKLCLQWVPIFILTQTTIKQTL